MKSLEEEVAVDNTNPQEGAKDGNSAHASESLAEITPGGTNQKATKNSCRSARPPTTRRSKK